MAEDHVPRRPVSCQPGYSGRWRGPLRCEAGRPHLRKRTLFAEISAAGISACAWAHLGAHGRTRLLPGLSCGTDTHHRVLLDMEGPAVHQCKPSRRCRCIQRGRRGTGVSSERAVHVAAAAEWVGVTPERFAHARPPLRTPRISGRSRCGGHSARWDVPRPRAAHSGYFEGSRPRSQRGSWRRPASSSAACTGPSRYSTHKVGLEDMGGPDPPSGCA